MYGLHARPSASRNTHPRWQLTVHVSISNKAERSVHITRDCERKARMKYALFMYVLDVNISHLLVFSNGVAGQNRNNIVVKFFLA